MKKKRIKPIKNRAEITYEEFVTTCKERFGKNSLDWKFICPACGTPQTAQDLLNTGIEKENVEKYIAFSCIGRFTDKTGCNWTLGGLFQIHTLEVALPNGNKRPCFEIAEGSSNG